MAQTTKAILDGARYDTDKAAHEHYLRNYEEHFRPLRDRDVRLLELGVFHGGSLLLWRDYFPRDLDLNPVELDDPTGRVRVYQGPQQDTTLLDRVARECAPEGFDIIIIDDCGMADITHPEHGAGPQRPSKFSRMLLSPSHLFVFKA